jgi:hypothetical protein
MGRWVTSPASTWGVAGLALSISTHWAALHPSAFLNCPDWERSMRTLLALFVLVGGLAAWQPDASAGRKSMRGAYGYYPPARPRRESVCQQNARFYDPDGVFRGYPCWARGAFGQGRR